MKSKSETTLNEKDSLADLLHFERELARTYAFFALQTESEYLQKDWIKKYAETARGVRELFKCMRLSGYIEEREAQTGEIEKRIELFNKAERSLKRK